MNLFLFGLLVGWTVGCFTSYRHIMHGLKGRLPPAVRWPRLALRDTLVDVPRQDLIDACRGNPHSQSNTYKDP